MMNMISEYTGFVSLFSMGLPAQLFNIPPHGDEGLVAGRPGLVPSKAGIAMFWLYMRSKEFSKDVTKEGLVTSDMPLQLGLRCLVPETSQFQTPCAQILPI